jgi:hypothetical protein
MIQETIPLLAYFFLAGNSPARDNVIGMVFWDHDAYIDTPDKKEFWESFEKIQRG